MLKGSALFTVNTQAFSVLPVKRSSDPRVS